MRVLPDRPPKPSAAWPPSRDAKLLELTARLLPWKQIALLMGDTENAVKSRAYQIETPHMRKGRPTQIFSIKKKFVPEPLPESPAIDHPEPLVALEDLQHHHCHYPIGDPQSPDFGFCGRPRQFDRPYCPEHNKVAFVPAPKRRVG